MQGNRRQSWILDSTLWDPDSLSVEIGFLLEFPIPWTVLRVSKPWIPDSTAKICWNLYSTSKAMIPKRLSLRWNRRMDIKTFAKKVTFKTFFKWKMTINCDFFWFYWFRLCSHFTRFTTLETRKTLGRVNHHKDFWDCYQGQGKQIDQ